MREKSSSRNVLGGKRIQFRHSANLHVEHIYQSGDSWDTPMNKTGKNFLLSWSLHSSIWK